SVLLAERGAPTSPIGLRRLILRVGEAAKMPFPIHPHMFAMPVGSSSPTMGTTHGLAALPRAQEHSAHCQIHRNGARPVQGLLERLTLGLGHLGAAASGRRQARDDFRFPLNQPWHSRTLVRRQGACRLLGLPSAINLHQPALGPGDSSTGRPPAFGSSNVFKFSISTSSFSKLNLLDSVTLRISMALSRSGRLASARRSGEFAVSRLAISHLII